MEEFYFIDTSLAPILMDDNPWDAPTESLSRRNEKTLRDYFNAAVRAEKLEDKVKVSASAIIGYGQAMLHVYTDDATAQKIADASNGRLTFCKAEYHSGTAGPG